MIPLEIKPDSAVSLQKSGVKSGDEESKGSLSFAELLQGVKENSLTKNKIQNGAFILNLQQEAAVVEEQNETKTLSSAIELLMQADDNDNNELKNLLSQTDIALNQNVVKQLSITELKELVHNAKNYLKKQITSSEGFLRSEASKLPKTLKGLAQFAQKLGIDLSKITLEELHNTQNTQDMSKLSFMEDTDKESGEHKVELPLNKSKKKLHETNKQSSTDEALVDDMLVEKKVQTNQKKSQKIVQTLKNEPLFEAQSKRDVSTAELVGVKIQSQKPTSAEKKEQRADETLKLLLQGESALKNGKKGLFTQDFATATARVIAPQALKESEKTLETLLHGEGEQTDSQESIKNDNTSNKVLKAESFEVKLNEAKQMTKYLSQDVKNAIDNYKAPFTRLKVQLNPERLGEIELTVVQRGKNLHVNLSSNNTAINALAMNANDLKVQLQNSGINNASLNFSNNAQSQDQSASQQQQHRRESQSEYSYFEAEEQNEEIVSSLEIVVPNYA